MIHNKCEKISFSKIAFNAQLQLFLHIQYGADYETVMSVGEVGGANRCMGMVLIMRQSFVLVKYRAKMDACKPVWLTFTSVTSISSEEG